MCATAVYKNYAKIRYALPLADRLWDLRGPLRLVVLRFRSVRVSRLQSRRVWACGSRRMCGDLLASAGAFPVEGGWNHHRNSYSYRDERADLLTLSLQISDNIRGVIDTVILLSLHDSSVLVSARRAPARRTHGRPGHQDARTARPHIVVVCL